MLTSGDFSTRELLQEREAYTEGSNTWDLVMHVNDQMRFIVAMRDPVERLWSDFVHFSTVAKSERITPEYFHEQVLAQVQWWQRCVQLHSRRTCLYGSRVEGMPELRVHHAQCWLPHDDSTVCSALRLGLYVHYITDWLQSVPRAQFLFLSMERYSANVTDVINKQVLPFLGLESLSRAEEERVRNKPRQFPLRKDARSSLEKFHFMTSSMLSETRELLTEFYRPTNQHLAQLLKNDDFLWSHT